MIKSNIKLGIKWQSHETLKRNLLNYKMIQILLTSEKKLP